MSEIDVIMADIDKLVSQIGSFTETIANEAKSKAEEGYSHYMAEYSFYDQGTDPDIPDITVTETHTETEVQLNATGKDVVFAEFGAGKLANPYPHDIDPVPFPLGIGSYSSTVGSGFFAEHGHWRYKPPPVGRDYTGIYATEALQDTVLHLKQNISEIARRHFK